MPLLDLIWRRDELALAAWVGQHALPLFAGWLGGLLLLVAALWWVMQFHGLPRLRGSQGHAGVVALLGLTGLALLVGAAALFAELAEHLGDGRRLARLDEALTAALAQHVSGTTLRVFSWLTRLGNVAPQVTLGVVVAGLLWWRRERVLAAGWSIATLGNVLLNESLKRLFARLRPEHLHGLIEEKGFSFPSGHSSASVVAFGFLAYLALRLLPRGAHLPALLLAVALVATVGASRVFLQVHYASDVLAGFASGLTWLLMSIASVEWLRPRRARP